jgi:hypothetical protein
VAAQVDTRLSNSIVAAEVSLRQAFQDSGTHQTSGQSPLSIIVRTINGIFDVLQAKSSDSISSMKHKISRRTLLALADSMLSDHGVADQSVIHLLWDVSPYQHLFIFSYVDGAFYPLLVHPDETVRDVKERIQTQGGIIVELQQLAFLDFILDDDHQVSLYSTSMTGLPAVFHLRLRACAA